MYSAKEKYVLRRRRRRRREM